VSERSDCLLGWLSFHLLLGCFTTLWFCINVVYLCICVFVYLCICVFVCVCVCVDVVARSAQTTLQPFEETVRELEKQKAGHEKSTKSVQERKIKADERLEVARDVVEELDIDIETSKMNVETCATMRRQHEENLRMMNENLRQLDEQYQRSLTNVPALQEQLKVASREYEEASAQVHALTDRQNNLKFELRAPHAAVHEKQQELNRVKDSREAFCNKIQGRHPHVVTAMRWIEQNRNLFRGQCFGPVGVEIEVKSPEDAAMLEYVIPSQKMIAFLVETKEDEDLINSELRGRLRLNLNVTTMHNKQYPPQKLSREYLQRARTEYGFEGFLGDKCECGAGCIGSFLLCCAVLCCALCCAVLCAVL
jgi:hypothetical protein